MLTHTLEDVMELLLAVDKLAREYHPDRFGLPTDSVRGMEEFTDLVVTKLGLTIMEDERILAIQKHTGCTRAQAQSLIDSGDI